MNGLFRVYEPLRGLKLLYTLLMYSSTHHHIRYYRVSVQRNIPRLHALVTYVARSDCSSREINLPPLQLHIFPAFTKKKPRLHHTFHNLTISLTTFTISSLEKTRCLSLLSDCPCFYCLVSPISDRSRPQGPPFICFASSTVALKPNFADSSLSLRFLFGPPNC